MKHFEIWLQKQTSGESGSIVHNYIIAFKHIAI